MDLVLHRNRSCFHYENNDDIRSFKSSLKNQNDVYAIYRSSRLGPAFGVVDMKIAHNAGSTTESYARLGYTYQAPPGYTYDANNTNSLLGGKREIHSFGS